MVFTASRKLMLWYLEQQENSCFVFRATRKSMPQFQGPIFFGNLGIEPNFPTKPEKTKLLP